MKKINKLGVFSFAKFLAVIGGLIGLILGITYSFGGLIIDSLVSLGWVTTTETPGLSEGTLLAFGALIGMPVIFGIFGFLLGIVGAVLYNFYARIFGGIKIEFD